MATRPVDPPIRDSTKRAGRISATRNSENPLPLAFGTIRTVVTPIKTAKKTTREGNNAIASWPIGERAIAESTRERVRPTYFLY